MGEDATDRKLGKGLDLIRDALTEKGMEEGTVEDAIAFVEGGFDALIEAWEEENAEEDDEDDEEDQ